MANVVSSDLRLADVAYPASRAFQAPAIGFLLFILLNAVLFLRPAELIPSLEGAPIYEVIILSCLAVGFGSIVQQLTPGGLSKNPISACIIIILVSVVLSHATHMDVGEGIRCGTVFFKVILYYFLLVALVDTPARYRWFLFWIAIFVIILTTLSVLQYHHYLNIEAIEPYHERQDEIDAETNQRVVVSRLKHTGLYDNPNDLARILVVGIILGLYLMNWGSTGLLRTLWMVPIGLFGYALHLTHSRGGLLSLMAGLLGFFYQRFGRAKTILITVSILPVLAVAFAGRQTNIDTSGGTAQQRIQLWNEGFVLLQGSPFFGIGMERYEQELGLAAHNSFVQCFVELGLAGGAAYFGIFYLLIRAMMVREKPGNSLDLAFQEFHPYLWAILVATVMGMMSSTRSYSIPTYLIAGLGTAYYVISSSDPERTQLPRFETRLVGRLFVLGVVTLIGLYCYVRVSARYGD